MEMYYVLSRTLALLLIGLTLAYRKKDRSYHVAEAHLGAGIFIMSLIPTCLKIMVVFGGLSLFTYHVLVPLAMFVGEKALDIIDEMREVYKDE